MSDRFKTKLKIGLAFTVAFLASGKSLSAATPETFVGTYELLETREGTCDSTIQGFVTEGSAGRRDLRIGGYVFTEINKGEQVSDDNLIRHTSNSYTTGDGRAIAVSELLTKATGEVSTTRTEVRLTGDNLRLHSHHELRSPTEPITSFAEECYYRRKQRSLELPQVKGVKY